MSYRAASKISSSDSVEDAEYKAAVAHSALRQVHVDHFTRVIALIDYAGAHGILPDIDQIYPLAFATVDIPNVDPAGISHDQARALAQNIVSEMTFAIHEIELSHESTRPSTDDEALLRRSRAVVAEDDALQRLNRIRQLLHTFEVDLRRRPWSVHFAHPAPFAAQTDRSPHDEDR